MKKRFLIMVSIILFNSSSFAQEQTDTTEVVHLKHFGDTTLLRDSSAVTVDAKFTVEANGRISRIDILKNNCKGCNDNEKKEINDVVMNIIRKNPIAPRRDSKGNPKKTIYIQPFLFKLEED